MKPVENNHYQILHLEHGLKLHKPHLVCYYKFKPAGEKKYIGYQKTLVSFLGNKTENLYMYQLRKIQYLIKQFIEGSRV